MINGNDIYEVVSALVPLYVAMALGYGSVRWWKILTPEQSAGVNRFVAVFAVPFLSFSFISSNNPYAMNFRFLAGDSLQKVVVLAALFLWNFTRFGSIDWTITLFAIFALPNTLVMGVPLLRAMYGEFSTSLMIQIVVLQSCIWNTLLMTMFEYRAAKILIQEQFPEAAGSISTLKVDSDVGSLSGRDPLQADAEIGEDGKLHVAVRRSTSTSVVSNSSFKSYNLPSMTPRASSLSGVDIYSLHSPREVTPRNPSFSSQIEVYRSGSQGAGTGSQRQRDSIGGRGAPNRELRMFVWSPSASTASSDVNMRHAGSRGASADIGTIDPSKVVDVPHDTAASKDAHELIDIEEKVTYPLSGSRKVDAEEGDPNKKQQMPSVGVMTKVILIMVWRKLIRNPNTWASILGLVWSFIAFRFNIKFPAMIKGSITIVSNTGLGMAMFSLGLFMALQPKIIACGKKWAVIAMAVRFLGGPAVIAATSAAIGIRGVLLQVEIVQAALPQGIIPFVFAKEYNLHADIFSTAVIFGMVVALPVTIIYYALLGL